MSTEKEPRTDISPTGVVGLDDILGGGLQRNRVYLVEGEPGSGKTTMAMQFLIEGARHGEKCLYVTLSETRSELEFVAGTHGWSIDDIEIMELIPSEESLVPDAQYRMYHPSEVELSETTKTILAEVERRNPSRIAFDSISEMRMLAQNPFRYRRQVLALKHFFTNRECTVLLLDDKGGKGDSHLLSICHGVIALEQLTPELGAERRRLRVVKMRGASYRGGYHDFIIKRGGLDIFPRLVASEHHRGFSIEKVGSGIQELDKLLGGGIARGTSTLILGPAGSGKSSISLQYAAAAAERGENTALFTFDEAKGVMIARGEGIGIPVQRLIRENRLTIQQVDPAELSPG
jgi:circadian clock protein KaiC